MKLQALPWIILFLPLVAAGIITFLTRANRAVSGGVSIAAVIIGFVGSVVLVLANGWELNQELAATWLAIGDLHVEFGLRFDPLSLAMLLVVTGVASAIHIYSWGYMHDDEGFSRFFAYLSLFTFSMLGIVLANNFLQLFIFWELVGVSSYLLIGFWFERPSAADAGKKAFLVNRLGDFGFLLGILIVWDTFGSLNFGRLQEILGGHPVETVVGLLIFCGAVGKSAQFPLHVWLPDAMEGPTPVSALIHAATMVAAGVYMLCRVFFLLSPEALYVIALIGGITALLSALMAVQQDDIKRILAYSTLSQLGYMVMGVGLHAAPAAMFHLTTHAFFKALLFLGAGSVILALHHEQDIWKMGALRKRMPVTFWTFMVGTLALAGIWPLSGFFSKDTILAAATERGAYGLFALGVLVAGLTAFYMFRLVLVVFYGPDRSKASSHAAESPGVITWPLRLLAMLSVVGGVIGIYELYGSQFAAGVHHGSLWTRLFEPFTHAPVAAFSGLLAAGLGAGGAIRLYAGAGKDPLPAWIGLGASLMRNRFYFDEIYQATVVRLHDFISAVMEWIDRWIVDGLFIGLARGGTDLAGRALRLVQTGNLQTYAFLFALGVALVLWLALK